MSSSKHNKNNVIFSQNNDTYYDIDLVSEESKLPQTQLVKKKSNLKVISNLLSPSSPKKKNNNPDIICEFFKSPDTPVTPITNQDNNSSNFVMNDITEISPLNQVGNPSLPEGNIHSSPFIPEKKPSSVGTVKPGIKLSNNLGSISEFEDQNNDIKYYLELREEQKRRNSKRRESIRKKRVSYESAHQVRKSVQMEITEIIQMVEKSEKQTALGRSKKLLKLTDLFLAIVICGNIAISIIDNELYMNYSDEYLNPLNQTITSSVLSQITNREITKQENALRFINIGIVIAALLLVCFHYHIKLKLLKADNKLSKYDNIFTSGQYKFLFIELFFVGIFYPPFINRAISGMLLNVYFVYNYNAIISIFVIIKSYLVFRVYSYYSRWTSDSANSIGNKYNVKAGLHFALKAEMKKRPYTMLVIVTCIAMAICAFCVRTFEYGIFDSNSNATNLKGDNDLQNLQNCFWLIIVTMVTVGYGDMYPKSHFGRFVVIIASILGMLLVSLIVVSLAVLTEFTDEEKKAYNVIKKIQADSSAFQKAANVICDICKLRYLNEKKRKKRLQGENILGQRFIILTQLKRNISFFKNDFKIAASFAIPVDEMLKFLEFKLTGDLKELNGKLTSLNETEKKLENIEKMQEDLSTKMDPILRRQEKIAKYIIDLNNRNYIATIAKKRQKQRMMQNVSTNSNTRDKRKKISNFSPYIESKHTSSVYTKNVSQFH